MTRIAQCHCGQVKLTCEGDPNPVILCHCELCQRRTGSVIHLGAWFAATDVTFEGETKQFVRTSGDEGSEAEFHFCPTCGTSVFWPNREGVPEGPLAGRVGVAVGCFADPAFPAPTLSIYGKRRHSWVEQPEGMPSFVEGFGGETE